MNKTCKKYSSEEISRFVDKELPQALHHAVEQHRAHCPDCSRLIVQYSTFAAVFTDHADQEILKIDPSRLGQDIIRTLKSSKPKSFPNIFGFFGKNIYLKLASITAILMLSLIPFQGILFGPSGPSAIVKSVDTDFASVMIFETQKEHHTIIWFSET